MDNLVYTIKSIKECYDDFGNKYAVVDTILVENVNVSDMKDYVVDKFNSGYSSFTIDRLCSLK